jgi:hypothetical protein
LQSRTAGETAISSLFDKANALLMKLQCHKNSERVPAKRNFRDGDLKQPLASHASFAGQIAKTEGMFDDGVGTVTRRPGVWKPLTE